MARVTAFLAVWCVVITSGLAAEKPAKIPLALERMLVGQWQGPACGGDWTYAADGTFERAEYAARLRAGFFPSIGDPQLAKVYQEECARVGFTGGFTSMPGGPETCMMRRCPCARRRRTIS